MALLTFKMSKCNIIVVDYIFGQYVYLKSMKPNSRENGTVQLSGQTERKRKLSQ